MSVWIDHVKKVQKEKGITYKEAMVEAKKTYEKPFKQKTTTPQPELHHRLSKPKEDKSKEDKSKEKPKKPLKLKSVKPSPEFHQRLNVEKEKPKRDFEKAKQLIKDTTPEAHKVVKELVGGKMTKLLVEDQGGLAHIYPLHHDKVLKLYS